MIPKMCSKRRDNGNKIDMDAGVFGTKSELVAEMVMIIAEI